MASTVTVVVPKLYCPFPSAVHPRESDIEDRLIEWLVDMDIPRDGADEARIRRTGWGRLVARCFPLGDFERTVLFAKLWALAGEYDQIGVEEAASSGRATRAASNLLRLLTILNEPHAPVPDDATAWERAWRAWMVQFDQVASPFQHVRFLAGLAEYCLGGACEAVYRGLGQHPPLAEYLAIRRFTAALRWAYANAPIELGRGIELSPDLWHDPRVQALTKSAQRVFMYTNDIYSCLKDPQMSLPTALARQHGWTLQQGLDEAVRMHREETEAFVELAAALRPTAAAPLPVYIESLEACLAGHDGWYQVTGRYTPPADGAAASPRHPS